MAFIPSSNTQGSIGQENGDLVKLSGVKNPFKWFKFFFIKDNN
ncbi:MAG: hypothetical protein ACD_72C00382G0001 [uncultured bacterium]|nr:MAG: hypothetical protein ACD_72C00382G0001 [uncultured bacterium]